MASETAAQRTHHQLSEQQSNISYPIFYRIIQLGSCKAFHLSHQYRAPIISMVLLAR